MLCYYRALASKKAAIAFSYDDSGGTASAADKSALAAATHGKQESSDEEAPDDFEDVDLGGL